MCPLIWIIEEMVMCVLYPNNHPYYNTMVSELKPWQSRSRRIPVRGLAGSIYRHSLGEKFTLSFLFH
jgi:hypothetical protein